MLKFILVLCAALFLLGLVAHFAGPAAMGSTAVVVPHFGWPLTWAFLAFVGLVAVCWKVAHSK